MIEKYEIKKSYLNRAFRKNIEIAYNIKNYPIYAEIKNIKSKNPNVKLFNKEVLIGEYQGKNCLSKQYLILLNTFFD
jgi:hypothetical protein